MEKKDYFKEQEATFEFLKKRTAELYPILKFVESQVIGYENFFKSVYHPEEIFKSISIIMEFANQNRALYEQIGQNIGLSKSQLELALNILKETETQHKAIDNVIQLQHSIIASTERVLTNYQRQIEVPLYYERAFKRYLELKERVKPKIESVTDARDLLCFLDKSDLKHIDLILYLLGSIGILADNVNVKVLLAWTIVILFVIKSYVIEPK